METSNTVYSFPCSPRLKQFYKEQVATAVRPGIDLNDSDIFQLHSPEKRSHTEENDESFPPLPPPMPTLNQLKSAPRRKKLKLAKGFYDDTCSSPGQSIRNVSPLSPNVYQLHESPCSFPPLSPNINQLHESPCSFQYHDLSIHEPGITCSTPETMSGGFFPEFCSEVLPEDLPSPILSKPVHQSTLSKPQLAPLLTSSKPQPSTSCKPQPSTSSKPQLAPPLTSSKPQPSASSKPQPSTSSKPQPSTSCKPQPSASSKPQSSASSKFQPSMSSKPQPSTSCKPQPSTSSKPQPSMSSKLQPSTSCKPQPSTSSKPQPAHPSPSSKPTSTPLREQKNKKAQKLMFLTRQKKQTEQKHDREVITVENHRLRSAAKSPKPWIPDLNLTMSDREILRSSTSWLTDPLIDAAQKLLKKANPLMSGFQSVTLGLTMSYDVEPGEFVQILHNGHGHWHTISTVGTEHPEVQMYDSVYSCCPTSCKAQIASLLATQHTAIKLKYMDVQMQSGGYDCGLFAIAYATALVLGKQPGNFLFDQEKMRPHLLKCFEDGHITMFPTKRARRTGMRKKAVENVPVYCSCRMPDLPGCKWLECSKYKEWYHSDTCVQVDAKYVDTKCKWFCPSCV